MKQIAEFQAHDSHVAAVLFSPDGRQLLSAGMDALIQVWEVHSWKNTRTIHGHEKSVNCLTFSPDHSLLASGSTDNSIRLWDYSTGTEKAVLRSHRNTVADLDFSPDGKYLGSCSYDTKVKLWDVGKAELIFTFEEHLKNVAAVAFNAKGDLLASGGIGGDILVSTIPDGMLAHRLKGHQGTVAAIQLMPDKKRMVSIGYEGVLRIWSTETWQQEAEMPINAPRMLPMDVSPDGSLAAIAAEYKIVLVDLNKLTTRDELTLATKGNYGVSFSPDGHLLACGSADKHVRVWELD